MTPDEPAPPDRPALPRRANGNSSPPGTEAKKSPDGPFDLGWNVREFHLLDGRPISIHRRSVRFACPLKTNPEGATLVGLKEGVSACPLKIRYTEFKAWWLERSKRK